MWLWIAFKFVSLYRMTQLKIWRNYYVVVVNCFQICIFVSDDTARCSRTRRRSRLWIAFKFVSLYRMTQRGLPCKGRKGRCELLSNLYLCIGWHSMNFLLDWLLLVVNCFQICIFVSDDTASSASLSLSSPLWIAFKFVSLYRMTQRFQNIPHSLTVVNCFQICIFVSDDTARYTPKYLYRLLWIAFKFVSLYRMTQPIQMWADEGTSCELLSNLYLCIGWHS